MNSPIHQKLLELLATLKPDDVADASQILDLTTKIYEVIMGSLDRPDLCNSALMAVMRINYMQYLRHMNEKEESFEDFLIRYANTAKQFIGLQD